MTYLREQLKA